MKKIRVLFIALILLSLFASAPPVSAEGDWVDSTIMLGSPMPDFSVETVNGGVFTLSEALQTKEMVYINLWATWCGPCRAEFPYLEEAYQKYQDRVAVVALSVEPTDGADLLSSFVSDFGLTFPVGSDSETDLATLFFVESIPTSVVVDRFGSIAFIASGSQPSADAFCRLFEYFLDESYTETRILDAVPPPKPTVAAPDLSDVAAALNPDGTIVFSNPTDEYTWPVQVLGFDGPEWVESTNAKQDGTACALYAHVEAAEGDYLAFDYQTSTEPAMDLLRVSVDGELVKSFSGTLYDWSTWAIPLSAGAHEIAFVYEKDAYESAVGDYARLAHMRLVRGAEAEALVASLPKYPVGDALSLRVANNENAREIVFQNNSEVLEEYFQCKSYWVLNGSFADLQATLGPDCDPEEAFLYSDYDGSVKAYAENCRIKQLLNGSDPYVEFFYVDSFESTGYSYTTVSLYPGVNVQSYDEIYTIMLFADEKNVDIFVSWIADEAGVELTWTYGESEEASLPETVTYTVSFVDQNGDPVPGCIINFCTDEACQPCFADANGVAVFTGSPYPYHLQVIRVPQGYDFDTAQEFTAPVAGGEMTFTVTKQ